MYSLSMSESPWGAGGVHVQSRKGSSPSKAGGELVHRVAIAELAWRQEVERAAEPPVRIDAREHDRQAGDGIELIHAIGVRAARIQQCSQLLGHRVLRISRDACAEATSGPGLAAIRDCASLFANVPCRTTSRRSRDRVARAPEKRSNASAAQRSAR